MRFIVMGFVLSWWRLLKTMKFMNFLQLTRKWTTHWRSHEKPMLEAKESSVRLYFASCELIRKILCLDDFECNSYTLYLYYIYLNYPQNCKEAIHKKKKNKNKTKKQTALERFLQHTHLVRESYTFSREKSL